MIPSVLTRFLSHDQYKIKKGTAILLALLLIRIFYDKKQEEAFYASKKKTFSYIWERIPYIKREPATSKVTAIWDHLENSWFCTSWKEGPGICSGKEDVVGVVSCHQLLIDIAHVAKLCTQEDYFPEEKIKTLELIRDKVNDICNWNLYYKTLQGKRAEYFDRLKYVVCAILHPTSLLPLRTIFARKLDSIESSIRVLRVQDVDDSASGSDSQSKVVKVEDI